QQNFSVGFHEITGWWKDTGKPEDLLEGNQLVLKEMTGNVAGEVAETARLQGNVILEEGARLEGNTFVRGPVVIGSGAQIKDAYIGPFTSIGENSYIEGAEVEHSIVMKGAEIVTQERIVDSILGHNTVIRPYQHTFPRGHKLVVGDNSHVEV
ncbi:MAG: glucose-1-phosphate thymidylyltransferase, partial [Candidatus Paceibacteria bacterium]